MDNDIFMCAQIFSYYHFNFSKCAKGKKKSYFVIVIIIIIFTLLETRVTYVVVDNSR